MNLSVREAMSTWNSSDEELYDSYCVRLKELLKGKANYEGSLSTVETWRGKGSVQRRGGGRGVCPRGRGAVSDSSRQSGPAARDDPAFVPRHTGYYQHDDRFRDENRESDEEESDMWHAEKQWNHDLFDAQEQAPKSVEELVDYYGYDIRRGARETQGGGLKPGRQIHKVTHLHSSSQNYKSRYNKVAENRLYKPFRVLNNNMKKFNLQDNLPNDSEDSSDSVNRIAESLSRLDVGNNCTQSKEDHVKPKVQTKFFYNSAIKEGKQVDCSLNKVPLASEAFIKEYPNTTFLPSFESNNETNNNFVINTDKAHLQLGSPLALSKTQRMLMSESADESETGHREEQGLMLHAGDPCARGAHSAHCFPDMASQHLMTSMLQVHCLNNLLPEPSHVTHLYPYQQVEGCVDGPIVYVWSEPQWQTYPTGRPVHGQVCILTGRNWPPVSQSPAVSYQQFPSSEMSWRSGDGGYLSGDLAALKGPPVRCTDYTKQSLVPFDSMLEEEEPRAPNPKRYSIQRLQRFCKIQISN